MRIRAQTEADNKLIHAINVAAFPSEAEASLVDALRTATDVISLVAEDAGELVGHILFSPVSLSGSPANLAIAGLAPMAVLPGRQRTGIGSELVRAGLQCCAQRGYSAVVVLGHPDYYPRFGFQPSTFFDITSEYEVPEDVFMALELSPGALQAASGCVRYHTAFAGI